jgi:hypothetical protein
VDIYSNIKVGDRVFYLPTATEGVVSELTAELACVHFSAGDRCVWVPLASLRQIAPRP